MRITNYVRPKSFYESESDSMNTVIVRNSDKNVFTKSKIFYESEIVFTSPNSCIPWIGTDRFMEHPFFFQEKLTGSWNVRFFSRKNDRLNPAKRLAAITRPFFLEKKRTFHEYVRFSWKKNGCSMNTSVPIHGIQEFGLVKTISDS